MEITFHNFGIVKDAKIDLTPLTIFIGANNVGKTWTAYALAGIFGSYGFTNYIKDLIQGNISNAYKTLDEAADQVVKIGAATIDLAQFVNDYGETYFNNVAHYSQHWIAAFLNTELISFENFGVSISLSETKNEMIKKIVQGETTRFIGGEENALMTIRKASRDKDLYVYVAEQTASNGEKRWKLPPAIITDFIKRTTLELVHRTAYSNVRVLPTERTTFLTYVPEYKSARSRRDSPADKNLIAPEQNFYIASGAVSHFLNMMQNIGKASDISQREQDASKNPQIKLYIQLAQVLEEQILGGRINYSSEGIFFQPSATSQLEISIVSSMVKELSPLLFYLRYLARPGELIVIDEPEMNLHPEAQVKIIEFLAKLVNANINVLITTHSPYVTDHLTNLIKANNSANKDSISNEFYLKNSDAFLDKEKVSVYLFDQGNVAKAMDENGIINLDTFGKVSDRISEIYFTL